MADFHVCMLRCPDGTYYVGQISSLESRIGQHGAGTASGYTARRLPVRLVRVADFPTRDQALSFERQLKR